MFLLRRFFIGVFLFGLGVGSAQAVPMYYTIEGTVESRYNADGIFNIGDAFSATYLIDTDLDGFFDLGGGSRSYYSDYSYIDASGVYRGYDFFYADYLAGTDSGIPFNSSYVEINYGYIFHYISADGTLDYKQTYFLGQNYVQAAFQSTLTDLVVGGSGYLLDRFTGADGNGGSAQTSHATVTYIGTENPVASVPEPSSIALMGLGLLGLGFARRKKAL